MKNNMEKLDDQKAEKQLLTQIRTTKTARRIIPQSVKNARLSVKT